MPQQSVRQVLLPILLLGMTVGYACCSNDKSNAPAGPSAPSNPDNSDGASPSQACPSETITNQKVTTDGNDVVVDTGDTLKIKLSMVASDVVRVWAEPGDAFTKDPSYAVEPEQWPSVKFSLCDRGEYLQVLTDDLSVRIYNKPIRVDFYKADNTTVIADERASGGMTIDTASGAVSLYRKLGENEHFYGLGQDNDAQLGTLDRRGTIRDMWTGQQINKGRVTADIPITFFMSTGKDAGGYGMFFDNTYRTQFDMGKESSETYAWKSKGGKLLYYFMYGPTFAKIVDRYTALTGRPSMPPLWQLGYVQSKCTYYTWDEIDEVVTSMRTKKIPLDAMVIDYDWPDKLQNFKWNSRWKGQSPAKLASYETKGVKFMISNSGPMIRKDSTNYADGLAKGIFASDGKGGTVTCGHYGGDLMDFTAPNMKDWLWPQMQHLYDEGIDAWWLDLVEPEGEPEQTVYKGGPSAKIHNVFSLLMSKAYYEMQKSYAPKTRPFILTRTGFAGIQKYGSAIWTGDISSDYQTLQAHCPEALNTSMSGIPFWTNDSGGFLEGYYKKSLEDHGFLYERWMQFSAFAPITRAHHVGKSAPYMFGASVEEGSRKYIQLRYRLLPYIYSYTWEAHRTGAPLMRALVFEYQNDPNVYGIKDEYLFGRELLVAPVLKEQRTSRAVYFPAGKWIDYDFGYEYQGNRTYQVQAPQNRIPVAVKAGAIIPMVPLMQYTGEKPWDPIILDMYPDGESRFVLYRDDGNSTDFDTDKKFTETVITSKESQGASVDITLQESNKLFTPKQYVLQVHLLSTPTTVTAHGQPVAKNDSLAEYDKTPEGWYWDDASLRLHAKFNNTDATSHAIQIKMDGTKLARPAPPELPPDPADSLDAGDDTLSQMPHFYPPPSIPCRVEAENYDKGGEGVAYHDTTKGNPTGEYRTDDVDIEKTSDTGGGYAVASIENAEWLEYTVQVTTAAVYDIEIRLAAASDAGLFHIEFDGKAVTAAMPVPSTGGAQTWASITAKGISLDAGEHVMRVVIEKGGFAINYYNFTLVPGGCTDIAPTPDYTCAEQAAWGKCKEDWMLKFCDKSCGRCPDN